MQVKMNEEDIDRLKKGIEKYIHKKYFTHSREKVPSPSSPNHHNSPKAKRYVSPKYFHSPAKTPTKNKINSPTINKKDKDERKNKITPERPSYR